jgi:zinc protease
VRVEASADHPIQKIQLQNGLTLLLKEDHRLPFVEFRAVFKGGVLAESPATNGATALMSRLLLKGTTSRTAAELAEQVESVGGHIHAYGGNNSFGLNLESLKEDFDFGMEIFADVLLNPTFPKSEAERERQIQIAGIRAQQDKLLQRTFKSMRRAMFGDTGYGLDNLGTETSVTHLQTPDISTHYQHLVAPNNCVLAIYGDIDSKEVRATVEKSLGDWKVREQAATKPASDERTAPDSPIRVIERRDKKQAVIVIGFPGVTFDHPDRYALDLLQESCSDMGSRLFLRIRDELGLAYYVGAQHFPGLVPGYFAFYVGTAPEHLERVESELFKEAELLRLSGLTPEELKRSKAKLIGQKKIARQDISELAQATALDELLGLGYDHFDREDKFFDAVTLDEVKTAAERHLRPERAVIAIIRPE